MAPEALSVAQARAARVGLTVAKRFKKRLYHGKVKGAAADMPDKEGVVWPLLYHIRCASAAGAGGATGWVLRAVLVERCVRLARPPAPVHPQPPNASVFP